MITFIFPPIQILLLEWLMMISSVCVPAFLFSIALVPFSSQPRHVITSVPLFPMFQVVEEEECADTQQPLYRIVYGDNDEEDMNAVDLLECLQPVDATDETLELGEGDEPAGENRQRLVDLVRLARHLSFVPQNWCSHGARGKHQHHHLKLESEEPKTPGPPPRPPPVF